MKEHKCEHIEIGWSGKTFKCEKIAKYFKDNKYYCRQHIPLKEFEIQ